MIDRVWAVVGDDRDYSMGTTWIVTAYPEKEMAARHANEANDAIARLQKEEWKRYGYGDNDLELRKAFPYDSAWVREQVENDHPAYYFPRYSVKEVPFTLHLDEYIERFTKQ